MADLQRDSFLGIDPGAGESAVFGGSSKTAPFVEFYYNTTYEKDFLRIHFPADRQKVWNQPVRPIDKINYRAQWEAYKQGLDKFHGQTMLETWADLDMGSLEIYKSLHIHTIEQLAALPDGNFGNFPPGHASLAHRHRKMAQDYLATKVAAEASDKALEAANQSQAIAQQALDENAELKRKLDELVAAQAPKRRGRPPKKKEQDPVPADDHTGGVGVA